MEEICRAAGIINPRKRYSITKVVEMLHSQHIRGLSQEMKRAAVLMALDAAEISLDQLQHDAKARQEALDCHEADQRKQVEAEWARKAEEIVQIQAELESIQAHYTARIGRNLEGVAKEKATFNAWLGVKREGNPKHVGSGGFVSEGARPRARQPFALGPWQRRRRRLHTRVAKRQHSLAPGVSAGAIEARGSESR